jgi:hypothetical protein
MNEILTPQNVESRLLELSQELDVATTELIDSETVYLSSKTSYEIRIAHRRLEIAGEYKGTKTTVQERDDLALTSLEDYAMDLAMSEAVVRAARANLARIKTQIDIARSLGTSVRSSFDVL